MVKLLIITVILAAVTILCTYRYARMGGTLVNDSLKVGSVGWLTIFLAGATSTCLIVLSQTHDEYGLSLMVPGGIFVTSFMLGIGVLFLGRKHYQHTVARS
ncbi:MAG TPA: hypothetical protein VFT59_00495 [Candidatus Saccharimonadales bacterium]|nr:hypothetical protein [Candidatus Saccharimonadales bacterium]